MARRNRWAEQASLEALLRFGPELSGLMSLQREAEQRYSGGVRTARATGNAIQRSAAQASPAVKKIYGNADETVAQANQITGALPAGVPASAAAAIAQEQSGFQRRMAESQAGALTGLKERGVAAQEGAAFAVQQARQDLNKDLGSIVQRRMDIGRESGAFTALTARELRTAAQDRADRLFVAQGGWTQQERNSLRSAGFDPDTGNVLPGGKADPKKNTGGGSDAADRNSSRGWASQEQHAAAQDMISQGIDWAKRLKEAGLSRADVAEALSTGREAAPIKDQETGKPVLNKDGTPKTRSAVPQIKSQLLLSAALDEVFDRHLSRLNTRRLHSRRLRIGDLPVTSFQQWRRQAAGYEQRTGRPARG